MAVYLSSTRSSSHMGVQFGPHGGCTCMFSILGFDAKSVDPHSVSRILGLDQTGPTMVQYFPSYARLTALLTWETTLHRRDRHV